MKIIDHFILIDDKNSKNYKKLFDANTGNLLRDDVIDGTYNFHECLFITDDGKLFNDEMKQIGNDKKFTRLIQGFRTSAIVENNGTVYGFSFMNDDSKVGINHENIRQSGTLEYKQCHIILDVSTLKFIYYGYSTKHYSVEHVFRFATHKDLIITIMDDQLTGCIISDESAIINECRFPVKMCECLTYYNNIYFKSIDNEWYSCFAYGVYHNTYIFSIIKKMNGVIDVIVNDYSMMIIKRDRVRVRILQLSVNHVVKFTRPIDKFFMSSRCLYGIRHCNHKNQVYLLCDVRDGEYHSNEKLILSDELKHNYIFNYPYDVKFEFIDEWNF